MRELGGDAFTVAVPEASETSALEKAKEDAAAVAVSMSNEVDRGPWLS